MHDKPCDKEAHTLNIDLSAAFCLIFPSSYNSPTGVDVHCLGSRCQLKVVLFIDDALYPGTIVTRIIQTSLHAHVSRQGATYFTKWCGSLN